MSISRREFLRSSAGAVAATAVASTLSANSTIASPAHRKIVLLELSGGNDALNTVIPVADPAYYQARPNLAIRPADALPLGHGLALHPAMTALHRLYQRGQLALVPGVGYPNPSRSHFRSMEVWHRADLADQLSAGWLARWCENHLPSGISRLMPMVQCGKYPVDAFAGFGTLTPPVGALASDDDEIRIVTADSIDPAQFAASARSALRQPSAPYPAGRLGEALSCFAQLILDRSPARFFHVNQGGFDTHARQAETHGNLLATVSNAAGAFLADLRAHNRDGEVLVMIFSEFGRRLRENSSEGTDHGAAGLAMFAGGAVRGGIHGRYPSLASLDGGDLPCTVDFRSCYTAILENWLQTPATQTLAARYNPLPIV